MKQYKRLKEKYIGSTQNPIYKNDFDTEKANDMSVVLTALPTTEK